MISNQVETSENNSEELELEVFVNTPSELQDLNVDSISIINTGNGLYLSSEIKLIHIDLKEPVLITSEYLLDIDDMSAKYDLDMEEEIEIDSIKCEFIGDSLSTLEVLIENQWFRSENITETFLEDDTMDINELLDTVYERLVSEKSQLNDGGSDMKGTKFRINNTKVEITDVKKMISSEEEKHLIILENDDIKFKIFVIGDLTIEAIGKACLKTELFV